MPEQPRPTYREEQVDERTRYQCLIPDARYASGHCDFWSGDEALLIQHLRQQHAGIIVKAPPDAESEDAASEDAPTQAPSEPSVPESAEPASPAQEA